MLVIHLLNPLPRDFSALLCALLTSVESITCILMASGFQLGSANVVRVDQKTGAEVFLSPSFLL